MMMNHLFVSTWVNHKYEYDSVPVDGNRRLRREENACNTWLGMWENLAYKGQNIGLSDSAESPTNTSLLTLEIKPVNATEQAWA